MAYKVKSKRTEREMDKHLAQKFQPQFSFKTETEARKELKFQKRYNPYTYKWLKRKDILVAGKRVPVIDLL